jgi:LysM repeat protein
VHGDAEAVGVEAVLPGGVLGAGNRVFVGGAVVTGPRVRRALRRPRIAARRESASTGLTSGLMARRALVTIVAVGALASAACGTTDPAAQERLPPIRTTVATTTTTTTTIPPGDVVYVVQAGDALGRIAERFGVTVQAIVDRNALASPDAIQAGQRLEIPQAKIVIDDSTAATSVP